MEFVIFVIMSLLFRISFRNDSTATLEFLFERQTGFFLLQIYTPLTLIVFCSWVAFWLMNTANVGVAAGRFEPLKSKCFILAPFVPSEIFYNNF